jgi:hypothetical protein
MHLSDTFPLQNGRKQGDDFCNLQLQFETASLNNLYISRSYVYSLSEEESDQSLEPSRSSCYGTALVTCCLC